MNISLGVLVLFFLAFPSLQGEDTSDVYDLARKRLKCAVATTCRECMQADDTCVWCSEPVFFD